jgi:molecular chaperone HtpG
LIERMKGLLTEVSDVRLTSRLKDSPACLVSEGMGSAHFERLMARMGRDAPPVKRVLELNPASPVVATMQALLEKGDDAKLENHVRLVYDLAVIGEGSRVKDPVALARRVGELLARDGA